MVRIYYYYLFYCCDWVPICCSPPVCFLCKYFLMNDYVVINLEWVVSKSQIRITSSKWIINKRKKYNRTSHKLTTHLHGLLTLLKLFETVPSKKNKKRNWKRKLIAISSRATFFRGACLLWVSLNLKTPVRNKIFAEGAYPLGIIDFVVYFYFIWYTNAYNINNFYLFHPPKWITGPS